MWTARSWAAPRSRTALSPTSSRIAFKRRPFMQLILIWLFTLLLILDSFILVLLVLIQLPKKEAGMGQAFGGTTTDALFGAGSGTALTKMTKYAAGIFFALTLLLAVMHGHASRAHSGQLQSLLKPDEKAALLPPPASKPAANPKAPATPAPGTSNVVKLNLQNLSNTSAPAAT